MYYLVSLFLLLYIGNLQAQALQTEWINSIPGSQLEQYNSIDQSPSNHIYAGGFFQEQFGNFNCIGDSDGVLTKYTDQGQIVWIKTLAGTGIDKINGLTVDNDQTIYITGEFSGTIYYNNDSIVSQGQLDAFVARLDSSGQFIWATNLGSPEDDGANDISLLNNGFIAVTGYFSDTMQTTLGATISSGLRDVFIANLNPQGQLQWIETIGGPGIDLGNAIACDNNNNSYITGSFRDGIYLDGVLTIGQGSYDAFLVKFTANGQLEWFKIMGGTNTDEGSDVEIDSEQNIVAVGWYDRSMIVDSLFLSGSKEEDGYAIKFDASGNILWGTSLAGSFDERAYNIDFDNNNDIYISGTLDSILVINGDTLLNRHLNRPTDIFVLKYDKQGVYQWATTLGHYYNDYAFDLLIKNSTTFYLAGNFQDTSIFVNDTLISQNGFDLFVGKFTVDTTTVAIHPIPSSPSNIINGIELFPNPSNNYSHLNYSINQSTSLQIQIINPLGQRQIIKSFDEHSIGQHNITLNTSNLEEGIYWIQLKTPSTIQTIPWIITN